MWLQSMVFYLKLAGEGETEENLILMFANVLTGSALKWFTNLHARTERLGRILTLQDYFDDFMRTYEGGLAQKMAEQKLKTLVYGRGQWIWLPPSTSSTD